MPKIVDHEERRAIIAATAVDVIAERGLANASIREVAAACKFNRGIIEHYFSSKTDLVTTAIEWTNQEYIKRTSATVGDLKGLAALKARLENILPLNPQQRKEWKVRMQFWALSSVEPAFRGRQSERFEWTQRQFLADLRQARQLGELKDELSLNDTARRVVYFTTGIGVAAMQSPDGYPERLLRQAIGSLLKELKKS